MPTTNAIYFSKFLVTDQVFFKTKYTYALVNLKPIVLGHVLVVPLRTNVLSLSDLSYRESQDYFNTVQLIQRFIKKEFKADSINVAIQDGPEAGQSVPHLHTHIIPRYKLNNFGDKIYEFIEAWGDWAERRSTYVQVGGRQARKDADKERGKIIDTKDSTKDAFIDTVSNRMLKPDDQRHERTHEEMFEEAMKLKKNLEEYIHANPELKDWIASD